MTDICSRRLTDEFMRINFRFRFGYVGISACTKFARLSYGVRPIISICKIQYGRRPPYWICLGKLWDHPRMSVHGGYLL